MRKYILILSVLTLGFASCSKENSGPPIPPFDAEAQAKIDDEAIKLYLEKHPDIVATKDESGLYYQLITEGTGENININSIVTVDYVGKTLKDTEFESRTGFTTGISDRYSLITGWRIGLKKAKLGSKLLLILPSGLAYGQFGNGPIPPNTPIIFTITVRTIQ